MSERDYRLFIQDIIDSIIKIEDYTSGLTFDAFQSNEMVNYSVPNISILPCLCLHRRNIIISLRQ